MIDWSWFIPAAAAMLLLWIVLRRVKRADARRGEDAGASPIATHAGSSDRRDGADERTDSNAGADAGDGGGGGD